MGIDSYKRAEGGFDLTRSICWSPPGCHGGCGVLLRSKNGKIAGVTGDGGNAFNRGQLCIRGRKISEVLYHPNRLIHPLVRTGRRGENKWWQVSFEDAIEIISDRLNTIKAGYGAESVIFCKGTARDIGGYLPRLCYGFGSPNYFGFGPGNGNACFRPRAAVSTAMTGRMPVPDLGQFSLRGADSREDNLPECILVWGANPEVSHPDGLHGSWFRRAVRRGAKLIVADPRRSGIAAEADIWLRLKPGSDSALALGFINRLFSEGGIDREYVRDNVSGADFFKEASRGYGGDAVFAATGVDADSLAAAVKMFAGAGCSTMIWGVGVEMSAGCVDTIRCLTGIMALTGNIDRPGGWLLPDEPFGVKRRGDSMEDFPQITGKPIGIDEYPLTGVGNPYGQPDVLLEQMESGEPYPVKAAWIQTAGIIPAGFADPGRVIRLFEKLDFIAVADVFLTPAIIALADVVLPAAMYPEKDSIFVQSSGVGAINRAVDPPGECRSDAEIIMAAGKKVAGKYFPWDNLEEWLDHRLEPAGMRFRDLREKGYIQADHFYGSYISGGGLEARFPTPSGKIELDSSVLRKCGIEEAPVYKNYIEEYRGRYGGEDFPFILTSGVRRPHYFGSEQRNIPSLRKRQPDPLVTIHPEDAESQGVTEGDLVRVFSPFGECVMKAKICDDFPRGVVHCDYGWWNSDLSEDGGDYSGAGKSNVNALLPSGLQGPHGYGYPFRSFICSFEVTDHA